MARKIPKPKKATNPPAQSNAPHPFEAAFRITSLRNCIKTHLNLSDQDLVKPISSVFRGQANPVDVIIAELGTGCYALTPRQVKQKINNRPVATVNDFIKYLGG
jgi:hypothetical protein